MRRWLAALAALVLLAGASTADVAKASLIGNGVIAHRGGAAQWPQNSLLAYRNALAAGAAVIESDTRLTADGVPVMSHDDYLGSRCSPSGGRIHLLTLDQVRQVRCGGEPIPTLAETIALVKGRPARFWVEVKAWVGQPELAMQAEAVQVAKQLVDAGMTSQTVLASNKWRVVLPAVGAAAPLLARQVVDPAPSYAGVRAAKAMGAKDYTFFADAASEHLIAYARSVGLRVFLWGTDADADVAYAVDRGLRLVASDAPTQTAALLASPTLLANKRTVYTALTATDLTPTVVVSAWFKKGVRAYPVVLPTPVPQSALKALISLKLKVRITSGNAKGYLSIGPRGSLSSASKLIRMPSGSGTYTVRVAPGDLGRLRVYTTGETAKVTITVLGYSNHRY